MDAEIIHKVRRAFMAHPAFVPGMPSLYDMRELGSEALTGAELSKILEDGNAILEERGVHRTAFIAAQDIAFGLARMYELMGGAAQGERAVFRDRESAEAWLRAD